MADLSGARRIELQPQRRQVRINFHRREPGIVHVQHDPLCAFHEPKAVLRNVGNNGRGDARIPEHDAPAAVGTLDAPEKGVVLLRLNPLTCERGCARCSAPDKVAARQRHDVARAIDAVETRRMRA
jgi:hypothetical protein